MQYVIEIDDEKIKEKAEQMIAEKVSQEIWDSYGGHYRVNRDVKPCIRELLKSHIDEITDKAVEAAASSITYKGMKKLLEKEK